MSGYRKRKSSDSLEGDRKRISLGRYDCGSHIKQEHVSAQRSNNGRQRYSAVPYNYVASSVAPVVACAAVPSAIQQQQQQQQQRYFQRRYRLDDRNGISSLNNYSSGYTNDVPPSSVNYDEGRQVNFKHEVYINSLRQSEPRFVNFNDLRRHLSNIDIRFVYNWNFTSALDLTLELESSLNYFVDTRNELVFLRKIQRTQCIPFSYNEINITNWNGLYNRMRFLEDESAYRTNRMNHLFYQLQRLVIPAIIDDIRYIHSVSYEKAWTNRARYWYTLFKQIKWEYCGKGGGFKYQQYKHRRPNRKHAIKDKVGAAGKATLKSDSVPPRMLPLFDVKKVKIEKLSEKLPPEGTSMPKTNPIKPCESSVPTVSHTVEHTLPPSDANSSPVLDYILEPSRQERAVDTKENVDINNYVEADKEADRSNSCVIVEEIVSLVVLNDDDEDYNRDSSNNANHPEGDAVVNECN